MFFIELVELLSTELSSIINSQHLDFLVGFFSTRDLNYKNLSNISNFFFRKYIHVILEKLSMKDT